MGSVTIESARSRAALLARTLDERQHEVDALQAALVQLGRDEEAARAEAVRQAPTQRTDRLGGAVARLRDRRPQIEKKIAGLEAEIDALGRVLGEARVAEADEIADEVAKTARDLREVEREAVAQLGKTVESFVDQFVTYADAVEAVMHHRQAQRELVRTLPEPEAFDAGLTPLIEPVMVDPLAAFQKLYDIAADPNHKGYRTPEGRTDRHGVLPGLVPDVRARARYVTMPAGDIEKITSGLKIAAGGSYAA